MRARLAAHKSWAHTENRATRAVSSSQGSNRDPPPETKRSETPRSHETRSFEWSRGGTHVPGRRPWTGGLLLTAGSITLQNGACLVVPTPTNKHRHGARQRSHHPDDSGGSTIPGTHPSSLGNLCAVNERLAAIERELSVPLPAALRSLYETSNGRFSDEGQWWVGWPLDRLAAENRDAWRRGGCQPPSSPLETMGRATRSVSRSAVRHPRSSDGTGSTLP